MTIPTVEVLLHSAIGAISLASSALKLLTVHDPAFPATIEEAAALLRGERLPHGAHGLAVLLPIVEFSEAHLSRELP